MKSRKMSAKALRWVKTEISTEKKSDGHSMQTIPYTIPSIPPSHLTSKRMNRFYAMSFLIFLCILSVLALSESFCLNANYRRHSLVLRQMVHEENNNHKDDPSQYVGFDRRSFVASIPMLAFASTTARAEESSSIPINDNESVKVPEVFEKSFLKGQVTTKADVVFPEDTTSSALYITARPNKADNVPRAILDGSNGKPPPVLVARYENPKFPFDFSLSKKDLTQEGASSSTPEQNTFWFEGQDLVVSARWDTDGSASTRDPTDLVGRSLASAAKSSKGPDGTDAIVQLEGRGMTGKFVTGKAKK